MKKIFFLFILCGAYWGQAQTTFSFIFKSDVLKEERNIRIHLPKSFDVTNSKSYPLIIALDGEYLFYSIIGVSEVLTFREIIPETIVVGIDQNYRELGQYPARWFDCDYNHKSGKIDKKGIEFKFFIENELLPYLAEKYRVGQFKTIAGHSLTANYINFFLNNSNFNGFIAISPYIPESAEEIIKQTLKSSDKNIYYFLSTGEFDLSGHTLQIKKQDSTLFSQITNKNFKYLFKDYKEESHMSLVTRSVTDALSFMYTDFSPIYTLNIDAALVKEKDLVSYLFERYENIKNIYGLEVSLREDDITSISWVLEEQENWEQLKKIGQIASDSFPSSVYGYYMIGLAEEKKNNLNVALVYYKKGYEKLGEDVMNKEDFYKDIERVEKLINQE